MKNTTIDIAIIGGGAAGLMCGCIAGRESHGRLSIAVFEQNSKTGRKLLATGNGRCNLGNTSSSAYSYFCDSSVFPDEMKQCLPFESTKSLFLSLGLMIKTDSAGRAYPQSGNASSVLDVLRNNLKKYGIEERIDEKVLSVRKNGGGFIITTSKGEFATKCVIIACGGAASPVFGSDGSGFALAKSLGHTVTKPYPSLTPIFVSEDLRPVKGVRCECAVKLLSGDSVIACEHGELQINDNNISGICVFNLSHYVNQAYSKGEPAPCISIDLLPDVNINKLTSFIVKTALDNRDAPIDEVLTAKKTFDFSKAQVSGGGVKREEIDFNTMSSKKADRLFFAGEVVDIDAACGGFNLQWAWASAVISAKSAVLRCLNDKNK